MREIKFRFFDSKDSCMYEIHHLDCYDHRFLMQYTGLKDRNGKEIYERDILQKYWFPIRDNQKRVEHYEIRFGEYDNGKNYEDACSGIGWYTVCVSSYYQDYIGNINSADYPKLDELEVIGNVFENPELLEVQE